MTTPIRPRVAGHSAAVTLLAAGVLSAVLPIAAVAAPDYQQWLDDAFPAGGPGAAALVVNDGEIAFRGAAGMADIELDIPMTTEHVLRIGSITKQFTAAGILLLEEQGKLKVTDDIGEYLPDYPTHGHTITIAQLLSHTSGIFNYTDIPGYFDGAAIRTHMTTDELIAVFSGLPMNFAPGDAYSYSNSGYVLLGAIIERVSGKPYAEYLQAAIFDPLGLDDTRYGGLQIVPNRARGYTGGNGHYRNAEYLSMTQPHGAGGLLSTVDDLAAWTAALFGGELLTRASRWKMTTDVPLPEGKSAGYGYGLLIEERFGVRVIAHNGGIHGFASSGLWLPGKRVYAIVLSNNDESREAGYLAERLAFDVAGARYPRLDPVEPDTARFPDYIGTYRINDREAREVGIEDGHLYTQRTGGRRSRIVAHGDDAFFYPNSFTHLTFDRDADGRVVAMSVYQNGADEAEHAERVDE